MNTKARNFSMYANKDNGTCIMWIDGCMNAKARNYSKTATRDNGTCVMWVMGCMDKTMMNFNKLATKSDGACVSWVLGCMDRKAHNFNKKAEKDDGSCKFHVLGCTDNKARNHNALATKDNKSCVYHIDGCMNTLARNFKKDATRDNDSCILWIDGCMTKSAYNYEPKATRSNASCKYWIMGCMNAKATNFMALATKDNGSCTMPKLIVKPVVAKCWLSALAGCFHPKTSSTRTKEVASTCVLTEIDSCNSPITHSDNWCWMKMSFSNCKSIEFSSGKCKTPTTRGKCNKSRINGNIIRIDLHSDYWKGNKKEAIPAGFSIYTDKNSSARFGTTGKETKTWKGRGRIVGASYDVSGEADFLQFKMCNDDSWWKQPAKTEQVCQSQNIAAKSVVWAADMLGVKCDGSTTAASALVSGAAILLSYSMLF